MRRLPSGAPTALALLVATAATAAQADALQASPDRSLSPYFLVEDGDPGVDRLPLKATRVEYAVSGPIAEVRVAQTYRNEGEEPLHARYVFPASTRAAVHGLTLRIGDRRIEARIRERERARREFEEARSRGRTASLLEEQRPNVFSMRVANVLPGDRIEVTLAYTEMLVPERGVYELVFPTVVGPRYASPAEGSPRAEDRFVETPYHRERSPGRMDFAIGGTLASAVPIREVSSPSHDIRVRSEDPGLAHIGLAGGGDAGADRDYVLRYRLAGDAIASGLSLYESGGERYFALVVEPPARVAPEAIPPREFVFVVDVSGSMHGFPLDTARRLLRRLVRGLRPQDRFNLLLFSGGSTLLSPRSLPATPEHLERALRTLDARRAGGGTELLPALERALALSDEPGLSRHFVVVTDGFVSADERALRLVARSRGRANVHALGIGSSVNRYLVEGLARAGLGEPFVATGPGEVERVSRRFFEVVAAPVLTDVRVQAEGFDVRDLEPGALPDLLAERPLVVFGRYRGPRAGRITLTGTSGRGAFVRHFEPAGVAPHPGNAPLRYLWARARIARLSDFARGEPDADRRAQLVRLGLEYNLLTQATSFVAVAHEIRNREGRATDVAQAQPLPRGVSPLAVGRMVRAPEPELWIVLLLGALALAALRRRGART